MYEIYKKIKKALTRAKYVTAEAKELARWKKIAIFFMILKGIDLIPWVIKYLLQLFK